MSNSLIFILNWYIHILMICNYSYIVKHIISFLGLDPSLVGLSLAYTITLIGMFQYCVRVSAEVENLVRS